jgi:hypothetical protein
MEAELIARKRPLILAIPGPAPFPLIPEYFEELED